MSASKAIRIVCRAYGSGTFNGLTFQEEPVDGNLVGVAETSDEALLAWFEARPAAFTVLRSKAKAEPAKKPKKKK